MCSTTAGIAMGISEDLLRPQPSSALAVPLFRAPKRLARLGHFLIQRILAWNCPWLPWKISAGMDLFFGNTSLDCAYFFPETAMKSLGIWWYHDEPLDLLDKAGSFGARGMSALKRLKTEIESNHHLFKWCWNTKKKNIGGSIVALLA